MSKFRIRAIAGDDRTWLATYIANKWGSVKIVSRGRLHYPAELEGFIAVMDNKPVGVVTFRIDGQECEVVTLNSDVTGTGIGSGLLEAVREFASSRSCRRVWLITTNDNTSSLRFYQKRGFRLAALYPNALELSRKLKPEIPLVGEDGIPLRDEIELEISP